MAWVTSPRISTGTELRAGSGPSPCEHFPPERASGCTALRYSSERLCWLLTGFSASWNPCLRVSEKKGKLRNWTQWCFVI